jgi:predicted ATPase
MRDGHGGQMKPLLLPRLEGLRIENYRALRDLDLNDLTPLTVLIGPNGSGKSTVFDALGFLSDCFRVGLRDAWRERGGASEIKTRGQHGPITISLTYRERPGAERFKYVLLIDERNGNPVVSSERLLAFSRSGEEEPLVVHSIKGGGFILRQGQSGHGPQRHDFRLQSPDLIAVNALGQLADHPRVAVLRDFISDWHVSHLSISDTRIQPIAGPQERLSTTGANLANVVRYLNERHPERWLEIIQRLSRYVPQLETVLVREMVSGRLTLQLKDATFEDPIQARYMSDGTLKLLACLVLLYDPKPPRFIALEEPENYVHPRLAILLGEDCRMACERSQVLATTHSPFFLSSMRPGEVRVLYRNDQGHTQARRLSDINRVNAFMDQGASLGDLWTEGQFGVGDPLTLAGLPIAPDF